MSNRRRRLTVQHRHLQQQLLCLGGFECITGMVRWNGTDWCITGSRFSDLNKPSGTKGRVGGGASMSTTGWILWLSAISQDLVTLLWLYFSALQVKDQLKLCRQEKRTKSDAKIWTYKGNQTFKKLSTSSTNPRKVQRRRELGQLQSIYVPSFKHVLMGLYVFSQKTNQWWIEGNKF